jgi:hypothetical protein
MKQARNKPSTYTRYALRSQSKPASHEGRKAVNHPPDKKPKVSSMYSSSYSLSLRRQATSPPTQASGMPDSTASVPVLNRSASALAGRNAKADAASVHETPQDTDDVTGWNVRQFRSELPMSNRTQPHRSGRGIEVECIAIHRLTSRIRRGLPRTTFVLVSELCIRGPSSLGQPTLHGTI